MQPDTPSRAFFKNELSGKALLIASFFVLFNVGMASPSHANWQTREGHAHVCAPGSSRHCVALQCTTIVDGGVYWYLTAPEPNSLLQSTTVRWAIDNRSSESLVMNVAGPSYDRTQEYNAELNPLLHHGLLQSLKAGNRLTVSSDQFAAFTVSLRGSRAALVQAMESCSTAGQTEPAQISSIASDARYPEAIIPALDEVAEVCSLASRDAAFNPEALSTKDINGDGMPDYLLDFGQLNCGSGLNLFCGVRLCTFAVFISQNGSYISGQFLGDGVRFGDGDVLVPCPGSNAFSTIRVENGQLRQVYC